MATTVSQRRRKAGNPATHKNYRRAHYTEIIIEDFQRVLDPKHVQGIADDWQDDDARVIECARTTEPQCNRNPLLPEQKGQTTYLSATDGQHTFRAGRLKGIEWFDVAVLPGDLTYEERAERYLYWHDATKPQHAYDRFHAKLECGQDRAVSILDATLGAGYFLGRSKAAKTLACISAIESVARDDEGLEVYARMLALMPTWDEQKHQFDNQLVLGFCRFLRKYSAQINDKRLRARMKRVRPEGLSGSAEAHRNGLGASTRMDYCYEIAFRNLYEGAPDASDASRWKLDR